MDFSRISSSVDVEAMQHRHVTMIGFALNLVEGLVKCGLGSISLVDFDTVSASNVARQDFNTNEIARHKAEVAVERIYRINPDVEIETHIVNYCALTVEQHDQLFGHSDLFIFSTDFFFAQARGNHEVTRLRKPALFIGLYSGGRAGEIIFWYPGLTPACYRCICSSRYQAVANGKGNINSTGATVFDLHIIDSIAGEIAVGLLTPGADNRMGKLISKLGNRNLLQIKIDPDYTLGGRDIFRERLGDDPANFSFTTMALPMEREINCPDCSAMYNVPISNLQS